MIKFCIVSIISFTTLQIFAQREMKPGYIIMNSGDTIYGQVDYQIEVYNSENCFFRKDINSEPITYKPGQIKAYRIINGKFFVSRKVTIENKQREVFLEFLVNGKADIFYLPPGYYFIEKEDQEMHILENTEKIVYRDNMDFYKEGNEYIGIMRLYMKECPDLYTKIQRSKLDQKSLIKIATEYHNEVCPGEECIIYSKEPPKNIFKVGYAVGCNLNGVNVELYQTEYESQGWAPGIMTGLQMNYSTKGISERFSTTLGFYYAQVKNNITLRENTFSPIVIEFLSKNIMIEASFNYTYPTYKLKPFVGMGVMFCKTLQSSKNLSSNIFYNPKKKSIGPLIKTGFSTDLSQTISLSLEANYQTGFFNTCYDPNFITISENINFFLILQYKITGK